MDDIRGYTLGQFHGFSRAVTKLEKDRMAALLSVITIGSRGDGKSVEKMGNTLSGG